MKALEMAKMLDIASVKMDSTVDDLREIIAFAKQWGIPQVCFNSGNILLAKSILEEAGLGNQIALIGTAAFPTGCFPTEIKLAEIRFCAAAGCKEIDICSNQGLLKANEFVAFEEDVAACVKAAHEAGMLVKSLWKRPA